MGKLLFDFIAGFAVKLQLPVKLPMSASQTTQGRMKSRSLLAAVTAGGLAFAPALGTLHAAPRDKTAPEPAANASLSQLRPVSVLPPDAASLNAALAARPQSFVTTTTPPCVTLTDQRWIVHPDTTLCGRASAFNQNVAVYPGIQYATAGRWQAPQPYKLSASPTNLTGFGPACPQQPPNLLTSENCLYLNVWVPPSGSGANLPVMVYIHGGAFITGEGSSPWYDGTAFATNKVILVTLNYRLGPLGFLYCPSSCNPYGVNATGNYGIMDQQLALKWVHDNIGAFGGDPTKVTIFGESAGAMSVGLHLLSIPSSTSLFRAAIMESNPIGLMYQSTPFTGPTTIGGQFLTALCYGISPTPCTQANLSDPSTTPLLTLLAAQALFLNIANGVYDAGSGYIGLRALPWQPVIDSNLIMGQPYQGYVSGTSPKPVVFGINKDEGAVFAATVAATYSPPSQGPSELAYDALADCSFQPDRTSCGLWNIFATQLANATARYNPANLQGYSYYNANGQSGANIVTDYDFAIGNIVMANTAQTQNPQQPMYAYYFTQPPLWDIYGTAADNGACAPASGGGNVCHAAELPYVFNTLANVAPAKPPQANLQLAENMNAAWAAFAVNPNAPGQPWIGYTNSPTGTPALVLNATTAQGPLDPNGVYNIWQPSCYSGALPPGACNNLKSSSTAAHKARSKKRAVR